LRKEWSHKGDGLKGERNPQLAFGDEAVLARVPEAHFLVQVERQIEWGALEALLATAYSPLGRGSAPPLVCLKMLLLEHWFDLSDPGCEAACRDRLSFMRFLGIGLSDAVPDETTLSRFRKRLREAGLDAKLFDEVNRQLEARHLIIKRGTLIDATIVESARKPPGSGSDSADPEAGFAVHKTKGVRHGYKFHVAVDQNSELIRAAQVTPGQVHDSQVAERLIQFDEQAVYADKAYDDAQRRLLLKHAGIVDGILHKAYRNRPLSTANKRRNKTLMRIRANVERVFADWKCRRSLSRCRYVGLRQNQAHAWLLAITHNLRRALVISSSQPQQA
jgi:transposase, IS5 family